MDGLRERIISAIQNQPQPTVTTLSSLLAIEDELGYIPKEAVEEVARHNNSDSPIFPECASRGRRIWLPASIATDAAASPLYLKFRCHAVTRLAKRMLFLNVVGTRPTFRVSALQKSLLMPGLWRRASRRDHPQASFLPALLSTPQAFPR